MFHFDRGLKLTKADLAIDVRRRQPRAFVSHAHGDHIARHELALCTPETAELYKFRMGRRQTLDLPLYEAVEWGDLRLTTYPAGHCLGSAMLLAEDGRESLLYTGDFKLGESATAVRADPPRADILVIECTYGDPKHRHPSRAAAIDELCQTVRQILDRDATPVVLAYELGKAQEVTRLLNDAGFSVAQHKRVYQISCIYEKCGVSLGPVRQFSPHVKGPQVVIAPPGTRRNEVLTELARPVTIAVTGWANGPDARRRLGVDYAIPLSDHADFDELLETVQRVSPREVYCTHGPDSFAEHLREAGWNAEPLSGGRQLKLF